MRAVDGVSFYEELTNCQGNDATILAEHQCKIPQSVLQTSPFGMYWGDHVFAKVKAINVVGESEFSAVGNGAQMLTNPDAPINFADNAAVTHKTQIGLTWADGAENGGSDIIDYRIWFKIEPADY